MKATPILQLLLVGDFRRESVATRQVPSTRQTVPAVETAIQTAWRRTLRRPGVHLFDGPVCRFESWQLDHGRLTIDLSRTSYRVLVGTNFCHPEFRDTHGPAVMANAIGVSTGLLTADGFWVMGRRNRSVAYYPDRVHPFAGSIEVADHIDLFDNAERELREEVGLTTTEIAGTRLVGLVEDRLLRHPEAIFVARTTRTYDRVAASIHADEHHGVWRVEAIAGRVADALTLDDLTPVAKAVLLLGGRLAFGEAWFGSLAGVLTGEREGAGRE